MVILRRTKIIPVKWIPDNHDSDWDGVPNYRDCQPFNPNKQDDNIAIAKRYMKKSIKTKSKKPLQECKHFMMSLTKKERNKIIMDDGIQELTYYIDRKLLPEIDPSHVAFGPYEKT